MAGFWAEADDPVSGLDDVEVVLDRKHGVAGFSEAVEAFEEMLEDAAAALELAEFAGELDALGFAAGEGGGGLARGMSTLTERRLFSGQITAGSCRTGCGGHNLGGL